MLIRLVNHHIKNPEMRDKLINIENFPESYFIEVREGNKVIKNPWEVDNPQNLSRDIKDRFYKPMLISDVVTAYRDAHTTEEFYHKSRYYEIQCGVVKLDYATGPGEEVWSRVERLIEKTTPRDMPIPKPAIVGNQIQWLLEAENVPTVVIPTEEKEAVISVKKEVLKKEPKAVEMTACSLCGKEVSKKGLYLHMYRHKKAAEAIKETAEV